MTLSKKLVSQEPGLISRAARLIARSHLTVHAFVTLCILCFDRSSMHLLTDGILIMVTGVMTMVDKEPQRFVQTFFLAPQERGYFVLNSCLRFLDSSGSSSAPIANGPQPTAVASGKAKESAPVVPPAQQEAVQEEKGAGKKEFEGGQTLEDAHEGP